MSPEVKRLPARQAELETLTYEPQQISRWRIQLSERIVAALAGSVRLALNRWLALANSLNFLVLAGAFLAPLLFAAGWPGAGSALQGWYNLICLQRPDHSFNLAGYQMGMEVRMLAITAGQLVAGLGLSYYSRGWGGQLARRLSSWPALIALSLPMLVDVFSQTLGLRGSDWFWRSLTGLVFGLATVWFIYPRLEKFIWRLRTRL